MGNKASKKVYDLLATEFKEQRTIGEKLPMQGISEANIMRYLSQLVVKEIKDTEIDTLEKDLRLNTPPEETKEERESRQKIVQEQRTQGGLGAGHEKLAEIKAIFQGSSLDEVPTLKLDSSRAFTRTMVLNFVATLLLLVDKAAGKDQGPSFYARLSDALLRSDCNESQAEGSGTSAALHLAALFLDPQKLFSDSRLVLSVLDLFRRMPRLALYGWTKEALLIDRSVDLIRQAFIEHIEGTLKSGAKPNEITAHALKTLAYIGLARGNLEDFLLMIYYSIKSDLGTKIDISDVLEKLCNLPELGQYFSQSSMELEFSSLELHSPFEKLYLEQEDKLTDRAMALSSATDGRYVYFYNATQGLMALMAGNGGLFGKIHLRNTTIDRKQPLQLLIIKGKPYCWTKKKLFELDSSLQLKDTSEASTFTTEGSALVCGTETCIMTFKKVEKAGEAGGAEQSVGEIEYYDLTTKLMRDKTTVKHGVGDVRQIIVAKNKVILLGQGKYEIIELPQMKSLQAVSNDLLKHATFCSDSASGDLYTVFYDKDNEGMALGKFQLAPFIVDSIGASDERIQQVRQLLKLDSIDKAHADRQRLSELLGFYQGDQIPGLEAILATRTELLLALLAGRLRAAGKILKAADVRQVDQAVKVYKMPLAVNLRASNWRALLQLLELLHNDCKTSKTPETIALAAERLYAMLVMLDEHVRALAKCNLSLKDCATPGDIAVYERLLAEVITPIAKTGLSHPELPPMALEPALRQICENCIQQGQAVGVAAPVTLQGLLQVLQSLLKEKKPEPNLPSLVAWLSMREQIEDIANKILLRDKDALALIDLHFALEEAQFHAKLHDFLECRPHKPLFGPVLSELAIQVGRVIEKTFTLIG